MLDEVDKMKKHSINKTHHKRDSKTTAENLEARFDAGENVLDYFNPVSARVLWPKNSAPEKVTSLRKTTGMTQKEFSKAICISPRTLQQWEQGRREPEGPAKVLLHLVTLKPSLIKLLAAT